MSIVIKIDWKEVYNLLCEDCKKKFQEYVKKKAVEQAVENLFSSEEKNRKKEKEK